MCPQPAGVPNLQGDYLQLCTHLPVLNQVRCRVFPASFLSLGVTSASCFLRLAVAFYRWSGHTSHSFHQSIPLFGILHRWGQRERGLGDTPFLAGHQGSQLGLERPTSGVHGLDWGLVVMPRREHMNLNYYINVSHPVLAERWELWPSYALRGQCVPKMCLIILW